ncbi:TetR/AcrR family transcriptional regulator [Kitasatospora sp. NPDC058406]|uniref:TetR/AcrR family transcriptional regulator n=1 Tax=Streptomycetaceae TaxID=2062 RepID=UPI002E7643E6|nr:TetR/AcrR family transcriptional regulator [Streptomyces sp. BE303]MED7952733.1 TetR/AcrR family transcriptional regulator [Streptomyces sp. BE303]
MTSAPGPGPDSEAAPVPDPLPDPLPDPPPGTAAGGRGRKGAQRRTELLDAAEEVLVTGGGAELSMRAVATAAGVRLGHLQYYFPTHADLVAAVLERVLGRSAERLAPLLAPGTDDRAGELVTALLAEQEDARLVRLFAEVWALAARDTAVAGAVRRFYDEYREQVAAFLARTRPELPEQVRRARAAVFVMLVEGAALFRSGVAGDREPASDGELLRAALALLGP